MRKRWVQHISGQGEKWELQKYQDPEWPSWVAPHTEKGGGLLYLPKSEYRLCDPPEVWRDVTNECELSPLAGSELSHDSMKVFLPMGYRFRKVELWQTHGADGKNCPVAAFIVEQKVKS